MDLGVSESAAYKIVSYRNRNGSYAKIEDITASKCVGKKFLNTYRDVLEV